MSDSLFMVQNYCAGSLMMSWLFSRFSLVVRAFSRQLSLAAMR
ncbi:hypothetical protein ACFOGG_06650 [Brenneria rubrifaciens]